jgi:hypothetical protein
MSIVTSRRVKCDQPGCTFESQPIEGWGRLLTYLVTETGDGKWYVFDGTQCTICRGCIIDRACRIFGHDVVRQPAALGGRPWCVRCRAFEVTLMIDPNNPSDTADYGDPKKSNGAAPEMTRCRKCHQYAIDHAAGKFSIYGVCPEVASS